MPKDYSNLPMSRLVKDCLSARFTRTGYIDHPATIEIWRRLPEDLRPWFAVVMYENSDPLAIRTGTTDPSDQAFFDQWRKKRDRDFPELDPDYVPPKAPDDGSDGAGAPLPGP